MAELFGFDSYEHVNRSAELSECGKYRWWLRRTWKYAQPNTPGNGYNLGFLMLNPSTADALQDDPTIRRCIGFARREKFSGISVYNLFCLRATDPKELLAAPDPVGPQGDTHIHVAKSCHTLVLAWGAGVPKHRDRQVLAMLAGKPLWCLGKTKAGHPRHPLYVRADQPLERFDTIHDQPCGVCGRFLKNHTAEDLDECAVRA